MLSKLQVQNVCLAGSGNKCCRYLTEDDLDPNKFHCSKLRPIEKFKIDEEINVFLKDCKRKKIDPLKYSKPIGNNCEGYLIFHNIEQGYDAD